MLMRIVDILAAILTVISLNLVSKHYKWWLLYIVSTIFYLIVVIYNKIPGLTILGIFLFITGIKNYMLGGRK